MGPRDDRLPECLRADLASLKLALQRGAVPPGLVASTIARIGKLPPTFVANLDSSIADAAELWRYVGGPKLWPLSLFAKTHSSQLMATRGLELIFLFHRDGFLREAALKRTTGGLPGPFFVAAVVWRLNDWVAPVRQAAVDCAQRCFPQTEPQSLAVVLLALATQRESWRRWDHERAIFNSLTDTPAVNAQIADLLKVGTSSMASGFRQLLRNDGLDAYLPDLARSAAQPAIRGIATQCLIDREARWPCGYRWEWIEKAYGTRRRVHQFGRRAIELEFDRQQLIEAAAMDRSASLRRIALSAAIQHFRNTLLAQQLAVRLRDDSAASVRSRAEFILKPDG